MEELEKYINETRRPVRVLCVKYIDEFRRGIRSHPNKQKEENGLRRHTIQVINKALELNQEFDRQEIIETCLVHDMRHWKDFPLKEHQVTAIEATKGLPWEVWRRREKHRFTALILIADMWSAYINEKDLWN